MSIRRKGFSILRAAPSPRHSSGSATTGVQDVRAGKVFFVEVAGSDPTRAESEARKMAEELLANTVIEGFDVRVIS